MSLTSQSVPKLSAILTSLCADHQIINSESRGFLSDLLAASLRHEVVDFRDPVRKYAMNLVLTLNYGTRVEDVKQLRGDTIFAEMVQVETEISRLRDTSQNYENYIPLLRPFKRARSDIGRRRVGYHKVLLENLRAEVASGTDKPCIQGNVLKDPESKGLSEGELLSVSLSMMAGADTSQPTVGWAILLLSQRPDIQQKAFDAIIQADPGLLNASDVSSSKVPYLDAFTKEIGRCYTALKLGLPRATHDVYEAEWNGATIPSKTLIFLNAWACSKGKPASHVVISLTFRPRRLPIPGDVRAGALVRGSFASVRIWNWWTHVHSQPPCAQGSVYGVSAPNSAF